MSGGAQKIIDIIKKGGKTSNRIRCSTAGGGGGVVLGFGLGALPAPVARPAPPAPRKPQPAGGALRCAMAAGPGAAAVPAARRPR